MIITREDVDGLRRLSDRIREGNEHSGGAAALYALFGSRLYPALTCGFDEIRFEPIEAVMQDELDFVRQQTDMPNLEWHYNERRRYESGFTRQAFRSVTGAWYRLRHWSYGRNGFEGPVLYRLPIQEQGGEIRVLTIDDLLKGCEAELGSQSSCGAVVLPNLWRAPQAHPTIEIVESTKVILSALQQGHTSLSEVTWRELEEIVAELLRSRGMEVSVTPRSHDGGRDILARGELIPGEPTILAVEVKHKGTVGIDDVAARLYRNKEFPALLFATSGRFSAGVIKEKNRPENFLRLVLKDGIALGQWISEYK